MIELGAEGEGPGARLAKGASGARRIVRLDTALYVATDASGKAVGQSARSILRIDRSKADAELLPTSADDAMADWSRARGELDRVRAQSGKLGARWWWNDPPPNRVCYASGEVPSYVQLGAHQAPNDSDCYSGCGPTAWAMMCAAEWRMR